MCSTTICVQCVPTTTPLYLPIHYYFVLYSTLLLLFQATVMTHFDIISHMRMFMQITLYLYRRRYRSVNWDSFFKGGYGCSFHCLIASSGLRVRLHFLLTITITTNAAAASHDDTSYIE